MSQVIEILEPLVAQETNREEVVPHSEGGTVTLYEVAKKPKEARSLKGKDEGVVRESEKEREAQPVKNKQSNGRSKSESAKVCGRYDQSPVDLLLQRSNSGGH